MGATASGKMIEWGIQFTLDDAELTSKVKAAKERTEALAKSIESGTYFQLQKAAIETAKQYDQLIKKSSQLILNEQRLAREAERKAKYGRLGVLYNVSERYRHEMEQRGYRPGAFSGGLLRAGGIGMGMLAGASAAGGTAVSETVGGSLKMLGLAASRPLIPALAKASKMMQDFAGWIDKTVDEYPKLTSTLGTAALAMAGLGAVGLGIRAVGGIVGGIKTAGAMVSSAGRAGFGILTTAGMIPRPGATSTGMAVPPPPMIRGSWGGGTAPMAQMAPAGSQVGAAALGATLATTTTMLGRMGSFLLRWGGPIGIGLTVDSLTGGHGQKVIGDAFGSVSNKFESGDWDSSPLGQLRTMTGGSWKDDDKENRRKQAMGGLGLHLNAYDPIGLREAAQSAVLNTTPIEAENFQLEVKNFQALTKEFGIAVDLFNDAVKQLGGGGRVTAIAPGS